MYNNSKSPISDEYCITNNVCEKVLRPVLTMSG